MAKKKVGVDIGHGENTYETGGGKGVKKNGKVYEEHHFNSKVGLRVDKRLKDHGFDTVMAQPAFKNDVSLTARTNKYNAVPVDIVVSIHANAGVKSANGACVFYWHTSPEGKRLAQAIADNFKADVDGVGLHGNGLHASMRGSWTNLHMVRETDMVAVLVECGFMTNDNDFEYIFGKHQDKYVSQVAEAIVKAVCEYFGVKYQPEGKDAPVVAPVAPKGDYKIKAGDTMYSIANKYGVVVQDLMKANPKVNPRAMKVGTYLDIPAKKAPKPKPKGDMKTTSIVTYLNSIGEDASFANREKLAKKYGIAGYRGTAPQNLKLLELMRKGATPKPVPKGDQKTNSIVVYLKSIGVNSSFTNRSKLAKAHGISNYRGTASQNLLLLKKMRGH
ncbi:N-acetylmuramoyl-L-alanine amidase protein [Bacillus phage PK2]|nr:N-acetylmuramoyl-L-alanine amidase protein [Bacillus phage PK2]